MRIFKEATWISFPEAMAAFLNGLSSPDDFDKVVTQVAEVSCDESVRPKLEVLVSEWLRCGRFVMPRRSMVIAAGVGDLSCEVHLGLEGDDLKAPAQVEAADPLATSWLWVAYWDFVFRNKPGVWPGWTGEVQLQYCSPSSNPQGRRYRLYAASPVHEGEKIDLPDWLCMPKEKFGVDQDWLLWDEAMHWLMLLLNSGHSRRFCRCVNCKRFFLLKRSPRRGLEPKRGNYCGDCKAPSSMERTSASRHARQERLIQLAAEECLKTLGRSGLTGRTGEDRMILANRINKRLKWPDPPVKKQWVARHKEAIQQRLEDFKNAQNRRA